MYTVIYSCMLWSWWMWCKLKCSMHKPCKPVIHYSWLLQGWETTWLCCLGAETHAAGHANLTWLPPLWLSRDPVVRSAALQLVAGFCSSHRGCGQFLSGLSTVAGGVWGAGLRLEFAEMWHLYFGYTNESVLCFVFGYFQHVSDV